MPFHIPRENTRYIDGTVPTLLLTSDEPVERLPVFNLDAGEPPRCDGWQFLTGMTVMVIDGPEEAGLLIEGIAHPEEAEERLAWLDSVERAGGAVVLGAAAHPPPDDWPALANSGKARGGFAPQIGR